MPKLPVLGPIMRVPGLMRPSTSASARMEYAGPTLCDPDGNPDPSSTTMLHRTPVSSEGRTTFCRTGLLSFQPYQLMLKRLAGSSSLVCSTLLARCRTFSGSVQGCCISVYVGPAV